MTTSGSAIMRAFNLMTESGNICTGNKGVAGEPNTIRIGDVQTVTSKLEARLNILSRP
jgi:hypothetical protein